jgi:hypothetical protein
MSAPAHAVKVPQPLVHTGSRGPAEHIMFKLRYLSYLKPSERMFKFKSTSS